MKKCQQCHKVVDDDCNFCPECGGKCILDLHDSNTGAENAAAASSDNAEKIDESPSVSCTEDTHKCPRCGQIVEGNFTFCPHCGANLSLSDSSVSAGIKNIADSVKVEVKHAEQKLKENEFVRSVHDDLKNSRSVEMVKNAVGGAVTNIKTGSETADSVGKILKIVLPIIFVLIIIFGIVIGTNIHTCDECGKTYLGKEYTISFFGESVNVCKDCYEEVFEW